MTTETLYEPRVLWDLLAHTYDVQSPGQGNPRVSFDRQNLRNTEQCPIQITHMVVDVVDYAFEALSADFATLTDEVFNTRASLLSEIKLSLMMPGRQYFTPDFVTLAALGAVAHWGPPSAPLDYNQIASSVRSSSIVNTLRWDFPAPIDAEKATRYEFALSSYALPLIFDSFAGAGYTAPDVHAFISFYEEVAGDKGGFPWPGVMIQSDELDLLAAERTPFTELVGSTPGAGAAVATAIADNGEAQRWPGASRHYTDRMNRSTKTRIRGFSVTIDQYAYDEEIRSNESTAGIDSYIIASLASKLACKARFIGAGTERKLWRDGAPLSLVCPTATPAMVVPFDQPITLMPGDSFDVEAEFPTSGVTANLGISFAGFLTQPKEK